MGGFLRMRTFLNPINGIPHAEERPQGASRSTHSVDAALARWFRQFFHILRCIGPVKSAPLASRSRALPKRRLQSGLARRNFLSRYSRRDDLSLAKAISTNHLQVGCAPARLGA